MIGQGSLIIASDYNSIQKNVSAVLGSGGTNPTTNLQDETFGYGQILSSSQIAVDATITYDHWNNLRNDLLKIIQHQTGTSEAANVPSFVQGDVVTSSLISGYASFASSLFANRNINAPLSQYNTESLIAGTRTTAWNDSVIHTVTISGASSGDGSAANLRYFFNAGGKLRISAGRTGGTTTSEKNSSWTTHLSEIGDILFDYTHTSCTGAGTGSSIGWFDLTTSDQLVFQKVFSGTYSVNRYYVYARRNTAASQLILSIYFSDLYSANLDLSMDGTLSSIVRQDRPYGVNVNVAALTAVQYGFETTGNQNVIYSITPSQLLVDETIDNTVTFTTQISRLVDPNALISWDIHGDYITDTDFKDTNGMSGTSQLSNGMFTVTKILKEDFETEGDETFYLRILSGGIVLHTGQTGVMISDTSITPNAVYSITPNAYSYNEGDTITITITSTYVNSQNNVVYWEMIGSASPGFGSSDITTTMSGTAILSTTTRTIVTGTGTFYNTKTTFTKLITNDFLSEGNEFFKLRVWSSQGGTLLHTSSDVTIIDTSMTPINGTAIYAGVNINNQRYITFGLLGINTAGTYTYTVTTQSGDATFVGASTGTYTIETNGITSTDLAINFPNSTSVIRVVISRSTYSSFVQDITVQARSAPTYTVLINASSSAINIAESRNVTISVTTTDIQNPLSTTLYWKINNVSGTITSSDFNPGGLTGSFTLLNDGTYSFTKTLILDTISEPNDSFNIQLYADAGYTTLLGNPSPTVSITQPSYTIVPRSSSVDEGSSVTFDVTTNIVESLYWDIVGSNSPTDFYNGVTSGGPITISSAGVGIIPITLINDYTTNSGKSFELRLKLSDGSVVGTSSTVTVSDTSKDPVYSLLFSPSTGINETTSKTFTATFQISAAAGSTTSGNPNITTMYLKASGTATAADYTISGGPQLTGDIFSTNGASFQISNSMVWTVTILTDKVTESTVAESIIWNITQTAGGISKATGTVNITDTSLTPTYQLSGVTNYTGSTSTLTENNYTATFTVNTTDVDDGTTLYWKATGNNITANDLIYQGVNTTTGSFIINTNTKSFVITANADELTEGAESFTVRIYTDAVCTQQAGTDSVTISILDTSLNTYAVKPPTGVTSLSEGSSIDFTVTSNNTTTVTIWWSVEMFGGLVASDFSTSTSGSFTWANTAYTIPIGLKNDHKTGGGKSFRVRLSLDNNATYVNNSSSITVIDTSQDPTYIFTVNNSIDENTNNTLTLVTTDVDNGTSLTMVVGGTATYGTDYTISGSPTLSVSGNNLSFTKSSIMSWTIATANDHLLETNPETITLSITDATGSGKGSKSINLVDTSLPGVYTLAFSVSGVSANNTNQNEPSTVTATLVMTNVDVNSTRYIYISGTATYGTDYTVSGGALTSLGGGIYSFVVTSLTMTWTIQIVQDYFTDGAIENITWAIRETTAGLDKSTQTVNINDSSQNPTYQLSIASSVNEGSSTTLTFTSTDVADNTTLYLYFSGTATYNTDYTVSGGATLAATGNSNEYSFVKSGTSQTWNVTTLSDTNDLSNETVNFTIRAVSGGVSKHTVETTIIDKTPTYTLNVLTDHPSIPGIISEGQYTISIYVAGSNITTSTTIYWEAQGTAGNTADIYVYSASGNPPETSPPNGSITLAAGGTQTNIPQLRAKADLLTEGAETLSIALFKDSARTIALPNVTVTNSVVAISDTSTTPIPTFDVGPTTAQSLYQNNSYSHTVTTANYAGGTLYWKLTGTIPSSLVSVTSGTVTIGASGTNTITVSNSSTAVYTTYASPYNIELYSSASDRTNSVNRLAVSPATVTVYNNIVPTPSVSVPSTVTQAPFMFNLTVTNGPSLGSATLKVTRPSGIVDTKGTASLDSAGSWTTESVYFSELGTHTATVTYAFASTDPHYNNVTIPQTSQSITSVLPTLLANTTSIKEGQSVQFEFSAPGANNTQSSTSLNATSISGGTYVPSSTDFVGGMPTTITLTGGTGSISKTWAANASYAGSRSWRGTAVSSATINGVVYTSTVYSGNIVTTDAEPFYSLSLYPNTSINEGDSFSLTLTTENLPVNKTIYWSQTGTATAADFDTGTAAMSGSFIMSQQDSPKLALTIIAAADYLSESTETVKYTIYSDSARTTTLASSNTVNLVDVYGTPTITMPSSAQAGNQITISFASAPSNGTVSYDNTIINNTAGGVSSPISIGATGSGSWTTGGLPQSAIGSNTITFTFKKSNGTAVAVITKTLTVTAPVPVVTLSQTTLHVGNALSWTVTSGLANATYTVSYIHPVSSVSSVFGPYTLTVDGGDYRNTNSPFKTDDAGSYSAVFTFTGISITRTFTVATPPSGDLFISSLPGFSYGSVQTWNIPQGIMRVLIDAYGGGGAGSGGWRSSTYARSGGGGGAGGVASADLRVDGTLSPSYLSSRANAYLNAGGSASVWTPEGPMLDIFASGGNAGGSTSSNTTGTGGTGGNGFFDSVVNTSATVTTTVGNNGLSGVYSNTTTAPGGTGASTAISVGGAGGSGTALNGGHGGTPGAGGGGGGAIKSTSVAAGAGGAGGQADVRIRYSPAINRGGGW